MGCTILSGSIHTCDRSQTIVIIMQEMVHTIIHTYIYIAGVTGPLKYFVKCNVLHVVFFCQIR